MILSLEDFGDHEKGYSHLLESALLRAPLLALDNIAFKDIVFKDIDYLQGEVTNLSSFVSGITRAKDNFIRHRYIDNLRKKVYQNFLEDIEYSKLSLFLNDHYTQDTQSLTKTDVLTQDLSNNLFKLSPITSFRQYFNVNTSFNCVEFFGSFSSYEEKFKILFEVFSNDTLLFMKTINFYDLKNGSNVIIFDTINYASNNDYSFRITSDSNMYSLYGLNSILSEGSLCSNGSPLKGCLKFTISNNATPV